MTGKTCPTNTIREETRKSKTAEGSTIFMLYLLYFGFLILVFILGLLAASIANEPAAVTVPSPSNNSTGIANMNTNRNC
jgi:hypothetical protein